MVASELGKIEIGYLTSYVLNSLFVTEILLMEKLSDNFIVVQLWRCSFGF